MAEVFVGIGSNIQPENHLRKALSVIAADYQNLMLSPVYRSKAVGFNGDDFTNLVASFETDQSLAKVRQAMKIIEISNGRSGTESKWSGRTLDIDILTFDDYVGSCGDSKLPREEILSAAYVLKPLADLAPRQLHPVLQKSYAELWQAFSGDRTLKTVTFNWRGLLV